MSFLLRSSFGHGFTAKAVKVKILIFSDEKYRYIDLKRFSKENGVITSELCKWFEKKLGAAARIVQ